MICFENLSVKCTHKHGHWITLFLVATCRLFRFGFREPRASLVAQMVKNLPAVQETQVWSLGWEDPLEDGMATHSSILAWRIPWTEQPDGLQSMGLQRVGHGWTINTFTFCGSLYQGHRYGAPYQGHLQNWLSPIAITAMRPLAPLDWPAPWPHIR